MQTQITPSLLPGLRSRLARFTGPDATPAELVLQFLPAIAAAIAAPAYAMTLPTQWTGLQ